MQSIWKTGHADHGRVRRSVTLAGVALAVAACQEPVSDDRAAATRCLADGALSTVLRGGIATTLDWRGERIACEGMPRPNGRGARLRLSGPSGDGANLAFILALPDLAAGSTAQELPTNVTLIEEGTGRFFGTADTDACWTDVRHHAPVAGGAGREYRVGGILYCVSPLAELNGGSHVSLTELSFTGRIHWESPE